VIDLALVVLAFVLAEVVLIYGAFPNLWRGLLRWKRTRRLPPLPQNVRAGCGHFTASWYGEVPLFCGRCGDRRAG
jgi:hypothetical protein